MNWIRRPILQLSRNFLWSRPNLFRRISTDDHPKGTVFMGEDVFGNRYYEAPKPEAKGVWEVRVYYQKTKRWMEPVEEIEEEEYEKLSIFEKADIEKDEMHTAIYDTPPEWESWLRGRRKEPPSLQEQARSARIMLKRAEEKSGDRRGFSCAQTKDEVEKESVTGVSFPVYDEYELTPGEERTGRSRPLPAKLTSSKNEEG